MHSFINKFTNQTKTVKLRKEPYISSAHWIITEDHYVEDSTARAKRSVRRSTATEGKVRFWKRIEQKDYGLGGRL